MNCPKCGQDISDSFEPDEPSVGIIGGWYCEECDLGIAEWEVEREPMLGDVPITLPKRDRPLGTPISELSGRPGEPGWEKFKAIARSWGYE
jgi:hypothetical protein